MITLCEDGYVRLTLATLQATPFTHLLSGLDDDQPGNLRQGESTSTISGYTEWVSSTIPAITLGWDWRVEALRGKLKYRRTSPPRGNLMLVDSRNHDLGSDRTLSLLEVEVDALNWQEETAKAISARYVFVTCQG